MSATYNKQPSIIKTGLLCNPLSGRIKKDKNILDRLRSTVPHAIYREASTPDDIAISLDAFMDESIELLIVAGGDGTVQAILSYLFSNRNIKNKPVMTILPGGTTNMTASDLGIRGGLNHNLSLLTEHFDKIDLSNIRKQWVLCIEQDNKPAIYGMFFGVGMIANGVKYFHDHIRKTGITGEIASAIVVVRFLGGLLLSHQTRVSNSISLAGVIDDNPREKGIYTMGFASTLERLLLGMRPYWGEGPGAMLTAVCKQFGPEIMAFNHSAAVGSWFRSCGERWLLQPESRFHGIRN